MAHTSGVSFPQQPSFSSSALLTPQIAILVFGAGHKASGPEAAYAMVGSGCPPTPPCENEDGGSGRGDVSPVLSQGALTSACPWLLLIGPVPPLVSWGLQRGNKGSRQPGEGGCLRGVGPLACSFLGEASFSVPAHLSGGASWVTGPGGDELRCPAPRKAQPDEWAHTWGREDRVSETLCQCAPRRGFGVERGREPAAAGRCCGGEGAPGGLAESPGGGGNRGFGEVGRDDRPSSGLAGGSGLLLRARPGLCRDPPAAPVPWAVPPSSPRGKWFSSLSHGSSGAGVVVLADWTWPPQPPAPALRLALGMPIGPHPLLSRGQSRVAWGQGPAGHVQSPLPVSY